MSGRVIAVRATIAADWLAPKPLRLAALLEWPHAFGVSHVEPLASAPQIIVQRMAWAGAALAAPSPCRRDNKSILPYH